MERVKQPEPFYEYQQRRLNVLLAWGLGSMLVGSILQIKARPFAQQWGLQALTWGGIDALIAAFGIRSARQNAQKIISVVEIQKSERTFLRILLINSGLDLAYVSSGLFVIQRFRQREDRRGLGFGILVQGLFLLLFDGYLSWEMNRRLRP